MLNILDDTHPALRRRSVEVELPLSNEDQTLLRAMLLHIQQSQDAEFATKHNIRPGVGLAAPQVGVNRKLIVIYYPLDSEKQQVVQYALANPKITSSSVRLSYLEGGEGCLSVPLDHPGHIYRPYKITVTGFDLLTNSPITIRARGYDAIVLQHEIDHLNGVLFYDHLKDAEFAAQHPDAVVI